LLRRFPAGGALPQQLKQARGSAESAAKPSISADRGYDLENSRKARALLDQAIQALAAKPT